MAGRQSQGHGLGAAGEVGSTDAALVRHFLQAWHQVRCQPCLVGGDVITAQVLARTGVRQDFDLAALQPFMQQTL